MPKRQVGDVIYLDSAESSGVETEYETIIYKVDTFPCVKKRKLYKVRYQRTEPEWLKENKIIIDKKEKKVDDEKKESKG